jgi:simple sugar transport system ATP-binding protein
VDTATAALSGGNQQKLILGRALGHGTPRLIVANQPTWGLDVGAVAYVHQQLLDACAAGAALLLISEDLDEIYALADRIAVIHQGRLTAARPAREWTLAGIGLAMAGGAAEAHPGAGRAGADTAATTAGAARAA